ncbi:MAG: hypothetical protein ACYC48_01285 [Minisyncoccota bacterium]
METLPYIAQPGKVIAPDERFRLMMAIALNPQSGFREGVIRCITNRSGQIGIKGNVDRSELHKISGETLSRFTIGERLHIEGERELIERLNPDGLDYLGLEDPDIWIDERTGRTHLYFTIPLISKDREKKHSRVSLGHAEGDDLDSLVMTEPVLRASKEDFANSFAKEVSIAPINKSGVRLNLFESKDRRDDSFYEQTQLRGYTSFSTVRVAVADDMGKPWQWGETVFHPADYKIPWIAEHASPGPLMSREFIDVGEGKLLGFMNGREASLAKNKQNKEIMYRIFSVGLFIYDYENGRIDWVSSEPLIRDKEAETITFASQFIETGNGEGMLYAHVDDSFVRAYAINSEGLKGLLP